MAEKANLKTFGQLGICTIFTRFFRYSIIIIFDNKIVPIVKTFALIFHIRFQIIRISGTAY